MFQTFSKIEIIACYIILTTHTIVSAGIEHPLYMQFYHSIVPIVITATNTNKNNSQRKPNYNRCNSSLHLIINTIPPLSQLTVIGYGDSTSATSSTESK